MAVSSYLPTPVHRLLINSDERRLRTPFRILSFLLLSIVLAPLVQPSLAAVFDFVAQRVGFSFAPLASGLNGTFTLTTFEYLFFGVVYLIGYGILPALAARYIDHRPVQAFLVSADSDGTRRHGLATGFFVGGLAGAVFVSGLVAAGLIAVHLDTPTAVSTLVRILGVLVASFLYAGSLMYLQLGYFLPNITEGLRGYLDVRSAVLVATLTCGLPFGLLLVLQRFLNPVGFVNYLVFSTLLGVVYLRTGRFSVPAGIMAGWFAVVLVTGVRGYQFALVNAPFTATQVTAPFWLGANYGLPGGVVGVVANVLLIIAVLPFLRPLSGEFAMMDRVASYRPRTQNTPVEDV